MLAPVAVSSSVVSLTRTSTMSPFRLSATGSEIRQLMTSGPNCPSRSIRPTTSRGSSSISGAIDAGSLWLGDDVLALRGVVMGGEREDSGPPKRATAMPRMHSAAATIFTGLLGHIRCNLVVAPSADAIAFATWASGCCAVA